MSEINLTLDPMGEAAAQQAPQAPTLTLTPDAPQEQQEAPRVDLDEQLLSEAERKVVDDFAGKIDITDTAQVLQYGVAAQKNVSDFSSNALAKVNTKDLGEVGDTLSSLVVQLKNNAPGEQKKRGFFSRGKVRLDELKAQYSKAETNVDQVSRILEKHQVELMKDVAMLDQMYELNQQYYKELTMYILAGKKKLEAVRNGELKELKERAAASGRQEDAEAYNDLANQVNRFEKKIHDLELTRVISVQMGPQTRLLQNNDTLMIEKIQTSLVNTIPLWKSQMVLALGLERSRQATAAQSAVTDMTNQLLKKNAEMLHMGTVATAKEAERSIVDLETLQHTNQELIATLDEVITIQKDGARKRAEAEVELGKIEGELKQKLLSLRG